MILALQIAGIVLAVFLGLFLLTFIIYIFNLDMKLAAALIKPLTAWYDWSKKRRDAKKSASNEKENS